MGGGWIVRRIIRRPAVGGWASTSSPGASSRRGGAAILLTEGRGRSGSPSAPGEPTDLTSTPGHRPGRRRLTGLRLDRVPPRPGIRQQAAELLRHRAPEELAEPAAVLAPPRAMRRWIGPPRPGRGLEPRQRFRYSPSHLGGQILITAQRAQLDGEPCRRYWRELPVDRRRLAGQLHPPPDDHLAPVRLRHAGHDHRPGVPARPRSASRAAPASSTGRPSRPGLGGSVLPGWTPENTRPAPRRAGRSSTPCRRRSGGARRRGEDRSRALGRSARSRRERIRGSGASQTRRVVSGGHQIGHVDAGQRRPRPADRMSATSIQRWRCRPGGYGRIRRGSPHRAGGQNAGEVRSKKSWPR